MEQAGRAGSAGPGQPRADRSNMRAAGRRQGCRRGPLLPLRVLSAAVAVAAMWLTPAATGGAATRSGVPDKLELEDGECWAHVDDASESCALRVYGSSDREGDDGRPMRNDYVEAHFEGGTKGYCDPAVHASVTRWYATTPGTSCVTAVPVAVGQDAEAGDPDRTITLGQDPLNRHFCGGFTTQVDLSANGAFSGRATAVEGGDGVLLSGSSGWSDWCSAGSGTPGAAQACERLHAQLDFRAAPSHARPRKDIQCKAAWIPCGRWEWEVSDSDLRDEPGGSVSVSVGWPLPGVGPAPFKYVRSLEDEQEGLVAGGWSYTGDGGIGSQHLPTSPLFEDRSGLYAERKLPHSGSLELGDAVMRRETGEGSLARPKGDSHDSGYVVDIEAKAVGTHADDYAKGRVMLGAWLLLWDVWY
jgi:hypothetical protein